MKNNNRCSRLLLFIAGLSLLSITTSANAALYSRLNGQAVYDSNLNITWTADANLAATLPFGRTTVQPNGQPFPEGVPGSMFGTFTDSWIGELNTYQGTGYLGFNDWRLTTDNCVYGTAYNCTDSEYGHLFYNELGGRAFTPISASNSPNLVLFTNLVDNYYWSGSLASEHIKVFSFGDGSNSQTFGTLAKYQVWAVRNGDVSAAVPLPTTFWLFGSGLVGLLGFMRRPANKRWSDDQ